MLADAKAISATITTTNRTAFFIVYSCYLTKLFLARISRKALSGVFYRPVYIIARGEKN
jgi:hypothetical protein